MRGFLTAHHIPFNWVDLEEHEGATAEIESIIGGKRRIPTLQFPDGTFLISPPNDELADKLGITRAAAMDTYDLVIAGGGPAALTTAIRPIDPEIWRRSVKHDRSVRRINDTAIHPLATGPA